MNQERMAAIARRAENRRLRAIARAERRARKQNSIAPPPPEGSPPPFPNGFKPDVTNKTIVPMGSPIIKSVRKGGCQCGKQASKFRKQIQQAKALQSQKG